MVFLTPTGSTGSLKEGIRELVDTRRQIQFSPSNRVLVCLKLMAAYVVYIFCFSNHRRRESSKQSLGHRSLGLEIKSNKVYPHQQGLSGGFHVWLGVQTSQSRAK